LIELEVDEASGKIVPTQEYIEKYNATVIELATKAEELQQQMVDNMESQFVEEPS
jgi:hypothetical protein